MSKKITLKRPPSFLKASMIHGALICMGIALLIEFVYSYFPPKTILAIHTFKFGKGDLQTEIPLNAHSMFLIFGLFCYVSDIAQRIFYRYRVWKINKK